MLLQHLSLHHKQMSERKLSPSAGDRGAFTCSAESSNLIVGIKFTKSNEWTGSKSYRSRSLHHIGNGLNPYEQAIFIIGKTLTEFDEDNLIPCYGFGDATTHDQHVSFYPEDRSCNGFECVLGRYRTYSSASRG